MRVLPLAGLILPAHAFSFPFSLDFFGSGSTDTLSTESLPHTVAIVGAGAAGSSAAFWLSKAVERSGVNLKIDVYERSDYIGGRSTVVYPYDNKSLGAVELGASIFVHANPNMWRASEEFGLTRSTDVTPGGMGFWDGEEMVFEMYQGGGWWNWWGNMKALWRYGYTSPKLTEELVDSLIGTFLSMYAPTTPTWRNISTLSESLGWTSLTAQTSAEYFDLKGVGKRFSREIIEAATRVNYGQNLDELHAVEGLCSMAADSAVGIKGGNFQLFEEFLKRSGADVHLKTRVSSIRRNGNYWSVSTAGSSEAKQYNDVIIAAPFHSTAITLEPAPVEPIPRQPYVNLHVTLLSTTSSTPNPEYFGLKAGTKLPSDILTTYEGARNGKREPEFNSLSYHWKIEVDGREEWVVKLFSKARLDDEWLKTVFGNVGWVHRKIWNAYPKLPPTTTFPPIELGKGLYYVNAFEPFISTMETETLAARNIAQLLFIDRFGVDICGRKHDNSTASASFSNGDQVVFQVPHEVPSGDSHPKEEGYVYGWDC